MKAIPICAAMMIFLLPAVESWAEAVGVVSSFRPFNAQILLKRRSEPAPIRVRLGMLVEAGDEIGLKANAEEVRIELRDGTVKTLAIKGENVVPDAKPMGFMSKVFHGLSEHLEVAKINKGAYVRGDEGCETDSQRPIRVPILRPNAKIQIGTKDLRLAWIGGCPPFKVVLARGEVVMQEKSGIRPSHTNLNDVIFEEDVYTLRITDRRGVWARYDLSGVKDLPVFPEELSPDETTIARIGRAIWLADTDQGAWRLVSFELIRPLIAQRHPLAGAVGDLLMLDGPNRLLPP